MLSQAQHSKFRINLIIVTILSCLGLFLINVLTLSSVQATHDTGGVNGSCTPYVALSANLYDINGNPMAGQQGVHGGEYFGAANFDSASNLYIASDGSERRVLGLNIDLIRADEQGGGVSCSGSPDPPPGNINSRIQARRITPTILPANSAVLIRVEIDYQCLGSTSLPSCTQTVSAEIGSFTGVCAYSPNWDYGGPPYRIDQQGSDIDVSGRTFWVAVANAFDGKFNATSYEFDWGDGEIENFNDAVAEGIEPNRAFHRYPTYGDFTFRYRPRTFCSQGDWQSVVIPVHKFDVLINTYRAEPDRSITQVSSEFSQPRLELVNGQQSLVDARIVDENLTTYTSESILTWNSENVQLPTDTQRPLGKTFADNNNTLARYYYIPYWSNNTEDRHTFDVSINVTKIVYRGNEIGLPNIGRAVNYFVSRNQLQVQPSQWQVNVPVNSNSEQTFTISNWPNLPSSQNLGTPSAAITWQTQTNQSWVGAINPVNQTLTATEPPASGNFVGQINTNNLSPGTYNGIIELRTEDVIWPATDAWDNPLDDFSDNRIQKAYNAPVEIPVILAVEVGSPQVDLTASQCTQVNSTICQITKGGSATLAWTGENATGVADQNINPNVGASELTGSRTVAPEQTTIYFITVENNQGQRATDQVEIRVLEEGEGAVEVIGDVNAKGNVEGIAVDPASVIAAGGSIANIIGANYLVAGNQRFKDWQSVKNQQQILIDKLINERAVRLTDSGTNNYTVGSFFNLNSSDSGDPTNPNSNPLDPEGRVWYVPGDLIFSATDTTFTGKGTIIVNGSVSFPNGENKRLLYQNPSFDLLGMIVLGSVQPVDFTGFNQVVGAYYVPNQKIRFVD